MSFISKSPPKEYEPHTWYSWHSPLVLLMRHGRLSGKPLVLYI